MSKVRMVQIYRDEAVAEAAKLTHESYKSIKHMNKIELVAFMKRISHDSFKAGYEAARKELMSDSKDTPAETTAEEA